MQYNLITVSARICKEPDLRTVGKSQVLNLSLAINRTFKVVGKTELQQKVVFIDCTIWSKQALELVKVLHKGSECFVMGRLGQSKWIDKTTQKEVSKIIIEADRILPISSNVGDVNQQEE
jgi:single stranded DNA-binding protein